MSLAIAITGRRTRIVLIVAFVAVVFVLAHGGLARAAGPCDAPVNVITCENSKPGTPRSQWDVSGMGDATIQGFGTKMSVDHGERIDFKVKTTASAYRLDIYRVGYYQGNGARLVATVDPSVPLPQTQPACVTDATSGLVDCGNWSVSAGWNVPADAVSGVYFARLVRTDTGGASHIFFIVRDDERHSDVLYQTSDETWQAYNSYGNVSLYQFNSNASWWDGRGYKVSYNRPLIVREDQPLNSFFGSEYPMVRWLERNGYDVSYAAAVDTGFRGASIRDHKMWISSGHDEYWSAEQRSNVEAARDAGVNLAFFSGNEMFWKTRWEPSIDGSGTPNRTVVCYKETNSTTRLDPTGIWTGSWRDPRFSPPSDGGKPENAVTGQLFMVNSYRSDSIEVPAADGKLRFWRNTTIDELAPGTKATLPKGVLGYEWDESPDNGFRPEGLIELSHTTLDLTSEYLLNFGTRYGAGEADHSVTIYKAASGALVFGAGTVQWSWGLDTNHEDPRGDSPDQPDARMQQATVNLFADMHVQPTTPMSTVSPATASTDVTPPTISMATQPPTGRLARGSTFTLSGTASDSGPGVIGAIEVSTDNGATWHRATGREAWSYDWNVSGFGPTTIKARAVDDSGNIGTPVSMPVTVGCPCTIWPSTATPGITSQADTQAYELGVKFRASVSGFITGVRFYKGADNTGTHVGHLWSTSGTKLGEVTFRDESATGWQTASFPAPIPVTAGTTYIASYFAPRGGYALDRPGLLQAVVNEPLRALADGTDGPNAVFKTGSSSFPTQAVSGSASNYWVDAVFDQDGADHVAPSVTSTTPTSGAPSASVDGNVVARFDEPLDPASVTASRVSLTTDGGSAVAATVSYDSGNNAIVIDPTARLARGTTFRATISGGSGGVRDAAGNTLASDYTWTFTTYTCPCTIWPNSATPATASYADTLNYELGVKFRSDMDGYVTGIRFYKGSGNTGTHLGHLWTSTGTELGEVTFTNETATGWQTAKFAGPIAIQANTTYIASYYDPNGRYALDRPGLATAVSSGPLRALADGEDGPNGVFVSRVSGFPIKPATTGTASNYWVDLVFDENGTDQVAPSVTTSSPTAGATGVAGAANVTAKFDEAIAPTSVNNNSVKLYMPSGAEVPAAVSYDGTTRTVTLDPTANLSPGTTYRAVLKGGSGGISDLAGNTLAADREWTFTTYTCPCTIWPSSTIPSTPSYWDTGAYELGLKFRADFNGYVTGVRFYKGAANTGTHVGHLWSATGTKLGEVTFIGETATGWQTAAFPAPIAVTAGTTYVVSYWDPKGGYAMDRPSALTMGITSGPLRALADGEDGGNGVFNSGASAFPAKSKPLTATNYWVDVVFQTG